MIYIYALRCPASGEIRYIGKTNNLLSRMRDHMSSARAGERTWRARWVRGLIARGLRPSMEIVRKISEGQDWRAAEIEEIARHKGMGCRLTNLTSGGDGTPGLPPRLAKQRSERIGKKFVARWADPEMRARMILSMRTPEARANRSAATTRRMNSEAGKAQHSATMKQVAQRPEVAAQIQAAIEKRWADYRAANPPAPPPTPEELQAKAELKRERQRQSAIARWQRPGEVERVKDARWTEEKRAAQAAALEARREKMNAAVSTEGRARQADAMRRIWAERKAAKA